MAVGFHRLLGLATPRLLFPPAALFLVRVAQLGDHRPAHPKRVVTAIPLGIGDSKAASFAAAGAERRARSCDDARRAQPPTLAVYTSPRAQLETIAVVPLMGG